MTNTGENRAAARMPKTVSVNGCRQTARRILRSPGAALPLRLATVFFSLAWLGIRSVIRALTAALFGGATGAVVTAASAAAELCFFLLLLYPFLSGLFLLTVGLLREDGDTTALDLFAFYRQERVRYALFISGIHTQSRVAVLSVAAVLLTRYTAAALPGMGAVPAVLLQVLTLSALLFIAILALYDLLIALAVSYTAATDPTVSVSPGALLKRASILAGKSGGGALILLLSVSGWLLLGALTAGIFICWTAVPLLLLSLTALFAETERAQFRIL